MAPELTEKEFSEQLNSTFVAKFSDGEIEFRLVEVKGYVPGAKEQSGMERFSLFFDSGGIYLPQGLYHLTHQQMGELDIFLVPVSNGQSFLYEAVFNYFK
jgi:Domain of unknown function (DUF6916)